MGTKSDHSQPVCPPHLASSPAAPRGVQLCSLPHRESGLGTGVQAGAGFGLLGVREGGCAGLLFELWAFALSLHHPHVLNPSSGFCVPGPLLVWELE